MIDYSIAGRFERHVHALAIIESGEDSNALGDGGCARGLFQHHPANFAEYYGRSLNFPKSLHDTWTEAEIKAAASFFDVWEYMGLERTVQAHNLGAHAVFSKGETNPEYLAKWKAAYGRLTAA